MLHELIIKDLGVIDDASILFAPGMTAVTGETGAGKTMIVGAIGLLVGSRADGSMVRVGCDEAVVEGRFVEGDDEVVVRRVVPRNGRSRAYVNGSLATAAELAERGEHLVDLHGQHAHQSLLAAQAQRSALDRFGDVDLVALTEARSRIEHIDAALLELGGDERARAREIDLCRFQCDEIEAAAIVGPDEDEQLAAAEAVLADAEAHRDAARTGLELVGGDGPVIDELGRVLSALDGRSPFGDDLVRIRSVLAELADIADGLRTKVESIEDDPQRLADIQERRARLHDLRRKYGDRLSDVLEFHRETAERLAELESADRRAEELDEERRDAELALARAQAQVLAERSAAAPDLADAVNGHLGELAMPNARLEIEVDGDAGERVVFLLRANRGADALPLAKTASGGELARVMLALRLVTTQAPPTLVFDEVDAGVGGAAAHAVGRALGALGESHQVLVVTHLAQVAAIARQQLMVSKASEAATTVTSVEALDPVERVLEVSRMLSGKPDSAAAQEHATELLAEAARRRGT